MEPIPETDEVLVELERYGDLELRGDLHRVIGLAQQRVPDLVGVSLSLVAEDLVLTFVANDEDTAGPDAVQPADDGPCLEAVGAEEVVDSETPAPLDESTWALFARASAAAGIVSSLSLPLRGEGQVVGGVSFYGGDARSFEGHVEELADLFGAWAPGAVANADLSFETRLEAVESPGRLKEQAYFDEAVGLLVSARGHDVRRAEAKLRAAAARAGVGVHMLARALVETMEPDA